MEIIKTHLSDDQYYVEDCTKLKKQIVLHHTAGAPSAPNTIHGWQFNADRVGTAYVIDGNGKVYEAFDPKNWAYHIAFSKNTNAVPVKYHNFTLETSMAKGSIGIEICNWGNLIKATDGTFRNYVNGVVSPEEVVTLLKPHRGFLYYHKYNDAQLNSLKELIKILCAQFNIPSHFNEDMFEINLKALEGEPGIYTHVSYRSDKFDLSPQPNLIQTLKLL